MKIALINENSQKNKNELILKVLKKVANKYHHEVFNFGVVEEKKANIDYVGAGVLAGILINCNVVDFIITGCSTGQGVMLTANAMPNVFCGFVADPVDARLFAKINAGNAISIPFGKNFGVGYEYFLEDIFETLFKTEFESGYPSHRKEIQCSQREMLNHIKKVSRVDMIDILEFIDKDFLNEIIHNDYFEEIFFQYSQNDAISEYLKNIIDAWE